MGSAKNYVSFVRIAKHCGEKVTSFRDRNKKRQQFWEINSMDNAWKEYFVNIVGANRNDSIFSADNAIEGVIIFCICWSLEKT